MILNKRILYSLMAFGIIIASCTKISETNIDGGGIPAVDGVNVFDTIINIEVYNNGALGIADETRLLDDDQMPLGKITNDPNFSTMQANMYLQLKPINIINKRYPFEDVKDSIIGLDSVVFSMGFRGTYGDTAAFGNTHPFTVKEINPTYNFKDSSYSRGVPSTGLSYYSLTPGANVPPTVGSNLVLNPSSFAPSTAYIRSQKKFRTRNTTLDSADNIVMVKLSTVWGNKFINSFDTLNAYLSDSAYNKNFNGLAIEANDNNQNSLVYYDLASNKTRLRFYYRIKKIGGKIDSTFTDFTFIKNDLFCAHAHEVKRTPASLPSASSTVPAPFGYIDAAPVSNYINLKVPGLATMSNRLLYLAELTVDEAPIPGDMLRLTGNFYQPSVLFLDFWDVPSGTYKAPKKDLVISNTEGTNYNLGAYGGFRNIKIDGAGQSISYYTFNLTRHIQDILSFGGTYADFRLYAPRFSKPTCFLEASNSWVVADGQNNPQSYLVSGLGLVVNPRAADGRMRIGGTKSAGAVNPMKLRLIYSKI
jgi:hypothetical protein